MKKVFNSTKRIFRIFFRNIIVNKDNKLKHFNTNNTIMSFNIRADLPKDIEHNWNNRKEAILRMITDIKPAIICMQEVMPHMYKYLKANLSNIYDCTSLNVYWFDSGKVIFYDKNIFKSIFYEELKFENDSLDKERRSAIILSLLDKNNNRIRVINTHLSAYSKNLRKNAIEKLLSFIYGTIPIYLCGDFNCTYPSDELKPFIYYFNITNSSERTFNHFDNTYAVLDYIISNKEIKGYKVINKDYGVPYISDHYPIIVNLYD